MKISKNLYDKVVKYTSTDYQPFIRADEDCYMLDEDRIISVIEDLLLEVSYRDEEIQDIKDDMNENYIPVRYNPYDEYGINEDDFH